MSIQEQFDKLRDIQQQMDQLNVSLQPLRKAVEANNQQYQRLSEQFVTARTSFLVNIAMPNPGNRYL
jgi:hypothetical protein